MLSGVGFRAEVYYLGFRGYVSEWIQGCMGTRLHGHVGIR